MKKSIIVLIASLAALMGACSESEIKTYDGEDFIYFGSYYVGSDLRWDTLHTFNFFFYPGVTQTTRGFEVFVGGDVSDRDRVFLVDVISEEAIEGVDFDFKREQIVPAGARRAYVEVDLYKTDELEGKTYSLEIILKGNENFSTRLPLAYKGQDEIDRTKMRLDYLAELDKPALWLQREMVIGYFSVTKFNKMNEVLGLTIDDWLDDTSKLYGTNFTNYMIVFANYLNRQVALGPEAAIKDPHEDSERGYMTFQGGSLGIPSVTIPADFPTRPEWEGNQ